MSLNLSPVANRIAGASLGVDASQAAAILDETLFLIHVAENVYDGLKGDEKFQLVAAAVKTYITTTFPAAVDKVEQIWAHVAPVVSLVVAVFKLRGLFQSVVGSAVSAAKGA